MILKKFWKNKKVFITGHTGFKGSWLNLLLQESRITMNNKYKYRAQIEIDMYYTIIKINNLIDKCNKYLFTYKEGYTKID